VALYASSVEQALHCLLFLVDMTPERTFSSIDLAELQGLSPSYVAKLFTQLKNAGLVIAVEGAGGGYQLARSAKDITVLDVVDGLEGGKPLFRCRDIRRNCALFRGSPPSWATRGLCSIHAVMLEAEQRMRQTLKEHSLADLAQGVRRKAPQAYMAEVTTWFKSRKT